MSNLIELKDYRIKKNISIEKMAEIAGMSAETYSRKEEMPYEFTIGEAVLITNTLEISLDKINWMNDDNSKKIAQQITTAMRAKIAEKYKCGGQ